MSKRWEKTKQAKQFQLAPKKCYMEAYEEHLVKETMRELTQDVIEEPKWTPFPYIQWTSFPYIPSIKIIKNR